MTMAGWYDFAHMDTQIDEALREQYADDFDALDADERKTLTALAQLAYRLAQLQRRDTLDDARRVEQARVALTRVLLGHVFPFIVARIISDDTLIVQAQELDEWLAQAVQSPLFSDRKLDEDLYLLRLAQAASAARASASGDAQHPWKLDDVCARWHSALNASMVETLSSAIGLDTAPLAQRETFTSELGVWFEVAAHLNAYTLLNATLGVARMPRVYPAEVLPSWTLALFARYVSVAWFSDKYLALRNMTDSDDERVVAAFFDALKPFADDVRRVLVTELTPLLIAALA